MRRCVAYRQILLLPSRTVSASDPGAIHTREPGPRQNFRSAVEHSCDDIVHNHAARCCTKGAKCDIPFRESAKDLSALERRL